MNEAFPDDKFAKVINSFHANRILGYLKDHGGKLLYGNGKFEETKDGCWIERTIILNPWKDSELTKNEIFGPIMKVFTFSTFDHLIEEINSGEKPLALYFIGKTTNNPWKDRLERETSSGMFVVNEVCL